MMDLSSKNNPQHQVIIINTTTPPIELPQISKHLICKLPSTNPRFQSLELFRQQIENNKEGNYLQPYTTHKKTTNLYKLIFLFFTLLFAILAFVTFSLSSHTFLLGGFIFGTFVKSVVACLCSLFSFASFGIAITIRSERDVIYHSVRKARSMLSRLYSHKQMRIGHKRFFAFCRDEWDQSGSLKEGYHDICEKINERKEDALALVNRIISAHSLSREEKDALLNQTVEELNAKLMSLVHTFRHKNST